jgi:hypothetical protein
MTRYREISSAEMTSAQKKVHDEIVAGRRGRFGGPFQILIRAPEVCRHLQGLDQSPQAAAGLPASGKCPDRGQRQNSTAKRLVSDHSSRHLPSPLLWRSQMAGQKRKVPARIGPLMWTSKPNLPSLPVMLKLRLR